MWILHAGNGHDRARAARARSGAVGGGDTPCSRRQSVPLHRLRGNRPRDRVGRGTERTRWPTRNASSRKPIVLGPPLAWQIELADALVDGGVTVAAFVPDSRLDGIMTRLAERELARSRARARGGVHRLRSRASPRGLATGRPDAVLGYRERAERAGLVCDPVRARDSARPLDARDARGRQSGPGADGACDARRFSTRSASRSSAFDRPPTPRSSRAASSRSPTRRRRVPRFCSSPSLEVVVNAVDVADALVGADSGRALRVFARHGDLCPSEVVERRPASLFRRSDGLCARGCARCRRCRADT